MRLVLAILLVCGNSFAASWYVDNAPTDSENTGASWANAWTNCASIVWGVGGVQAGDTLYFSGGATSKTYSETNSQDGATQILRVGGASYVGGTAESPITISVGTDTGHDGNVIFDGRNGLTKLIQTSHYNHVTGSNGKTNFWFINCLDMNPDHRSTYGIAISLSNADGTRVSQCLVSNVLNGVTGSEGTGTVVCSNKFLAILGDRAVSAIAPGTGTGYTNTWIHHNYIQTCLAPGGLGPDGVHFGGRTLIENNEFNHTPTAINLGQHGDAVQCAWTGNYTIIRNNLIHAPGNAAFEIGTAYTNAHNIWIYGNVVYLDDTGAITNSHPSIAEFGGEVAYTESYSNIFVINNTFVDMEGGWGAEWDKSLDKHPTLTNIVFLNNIMANCAHNAAASQVWNWGSYVNTNYHNGDILYNYNLEWAGSIGTNGFRVPINSANLLTQSNGLTTRPPFKTYSYASAANDFRLVSTVAGTNLTVLFSTYGMDSKDISGEVRATDGTWDVGAYEFVQNGVAIKGKATMQGRITF